MKEYDILNDVLPALDPAQLDYQQWMNVGFALRDGGYSAADWDAWSRRDPGRYHPGECERKWRTMQGAGVGLGTLVQYAREQGWTPPGGDWNDALGWNDPIIDDWTPVPPREHGKIIDANWLEARELPGASDWKPGRELARYLELLFEPAEIVGYVTSVWWSEEKRRYLPQKGRFTSTAGELIEALNKHPDDPGAVIGDSNPDAGAWIRFNPLDGRGVRNENVTEYRYALVESDSLPVEQQYAILHELELPARVIVHSGGRSLHAIVHIGAASYDEYRKRVDYLYKICEKNGLSIDSQNRNPSRLSRMPGILRGGKRQYIIEENAGKASFDEWKEWIEAATDDLPDPQNLADVWDELPPLAPALIGGVLRQGHKLLLAGPSKAGKSFALIELCIAIAEGRPWMGFPCAQGRVMYVNLELDSASCWNRIRDVYAALGWTPERRSSLDVWNLRGRAVPMDRLAPKLIRRCAKHKYTAIVIDPIYKVITGDENSADQMAKFCNQFDMICTELGCAVIYCHHHSKGLQGQKKSMDRASGSGVFARDPDAMLDMIELEVSDDLKKAEADRAALNTCIQWLDAYATVTDWREYASQDELCSLTQTLLLCQRLLTAERREALTGALEGARAAAGKRTAWRIEGTLREFPRFDPVNVWFDYPVHRMDDAGCLADTSAQSEEPPWVKGKRARIKQGKEERKSLREETEAAISACNMGEPPTVKQLAAYMEVPERTARDRLKKCGGYKLDKETGTIVKRPEA